MRTPHSHIPRIQESPRKVELWIPYLRGNQDPYGWQIDVEWQIAATFQAELPYQSIDEPYIEGIEYAGVEPVYLKESIDDTETQRTGLFLMRAPSMVFWWRHVNRVFNGRALVVVTREYLNTIGTTEAFSQSSPQGRRGRVFFFDEHRERRLKLSPEPPKSSPEGKDPHGD